MSAAARHQEEAALSAFVTETVDGVRVQISVQISAMRLDRHVPSEPLQGNKSLPGALAFAHTHLHGEVRALADKTREAINDVLLSFTREVEALEFAHLQTLPTEAAAS